ncbi:hypothetical protein OIU74_028755 [Salix koriyanagi]|uniref:Uncharacterized protein n=1 Tax=Salix koriyanagi TaxID=2511006 RepID=A0A9Q0ZTJ2_9ROSI|nr:hypothetical protein OIU74_028755 [Salix koriyanagi]
MGSSVMSMTVASPVVRWVLIGGHTTAIADVRFTIPKRIVHIQCQVTPLHLLYKRGGALPLLIRGGQAMILMLKTMCIILRSDPCSFYFYFYFYGGDWFYS